MNDLIKVLNGVDDYLNLNNDHSLYKPFSYYDDHILQLDEDFFREKINLDSDDELSELVKNILKSLDIPDHQKGRYTNLTVDDLFKELSLRKDFKCELKKGKIAEILELLDKKVNVRWNKACFLGLMSLGGVEAVGALAGGSQVTQVLTAAAFVPGIGILITLVTAAYNLSPFKIEKKAAFLKKARDSFFVLSKTALKLTAFGIALSAAAMSSPVISILTAVAEGIVVVHEAFKLLQTKFEGKKRAQNGGVKSLELRQKDVRFENEHQKKVRSLWIDVVAAVLNVAIVAAWVFIPGGIFVGIGALVAIGLTYFFQWKAQKNNDKTMKERLETKFNTIEGEEAGTTSVVEAEPKNTSGPNSKPPAALKNTKKSSKDNKGLASFSFFKSKVSPEPGRFKRQDEETRALEPSCG
jgi:hypothetical protein